MNRNKTWFLAASVAALMTVNGVVLAAAPVENTEVSESKAISTSTHREGKGGKLLFREGQTELLALLKMDAETLKSERKAGKSLLDIAGEQGVSEKALRSFLTQQMSQRLDEGVKAGRIDAAQAEKMKDGMDERITKMIQSQGSPAERGKHEKRAHRSNPELLALLKMDAETLKSERKAGKSLLDIAGEQGVSEKALRSFLTQQMSQRLDEGVKAGRIDAAQAEKMKDGMDERITKMIQSQGSPAERGKHEKRAHRSNPELLALLKIDEQTLKSELQSGQSLLDIAGKQGVSEKTLKTFLTKQMNERLERGVQAGHITKDKAAEMKKGVDERVDKMIRATKPMDQEK